VLYVVSVELFMSDNYAF